MAGKMLRPLASLLFIILLVSQCCGLTLRDRLHQLISKGNVRYHSKQHEEALKYYRSAVSVDSSRVEPHFNAGDALYRLGKYQECAKEFSMAVTSQTDSIAAMSYYNLGNSLFKAGDLSRAVEAYKRALLIDPGDEDAKFNLELALKLLEQQEQQKKKEQQKKGEEQKKQNEQDQKQQEQKAQQKQQGEKERQSKADTTRTQQKQPQGGEHKQQIQISPQELNRILAAIEASDRQVQRQLLKKKMRTQRISGKDW